MRLNQTDFDHRAHVVGAVDSALTRGTELQGSSKPVLPGRGRTGDRILKRIFGIGCWGSRRRVELAESRVIIPYNGVIPERRAIVK